MTLIAKLLSRIVILVVIVTVPACDIDLFGNDRRSVVGPYGLFVGEGTYYLVLDKFEPPCGILGGSVQQIGWNDRVILVQQKTCGGRGGRSGWVVVNVKTGAVEGPIDPSIISTRSELAGIKVLAADTAWKKLRN